MKRKFLKKTTRDIRAKRNYRRKAKRFRRKFNRSIKYTSGFPFPSVMYAQFKNEKTYTAIMTNNTNPTILDVSASNSYRPFPSATDTPTGYSTASLYYKNCTVMACKISVFMTDTSATDVAAIYQVTLNPERDSDIHLTTAQLRQIHEIKTAKSCVIEPSSSSPFTRRIIKGYSTPNYMYGVKKSDISGDPDEWAHAVQNAADPQKAWRWSIYLTCPWLGDVAAAVQCNMRILVTTYCKFSELNQSIL